MNSIIIEDTTARLLDQIRALRRKESAYTICYDYLAAERLQGQRQLLHKLQKQMQQSEEHHHCSAPRCCRRWCCAALLTRQQAEQHDGYHQRMAQQMVQECADLVTDPAALEQQVQPCSRARIVDDNDNTTNKKMPGGETSAMHVDLKSPCAVCSASSQLLLHHDDTTRTTGTTSAAVTTAAASCNDTATTTSGGCRRCCCSGCSCATTDNSGASSGTSNGAHKSSSSMAYWRREMFVWACRVADTFDIDREIVVSSFCVLDCYVARKLLQRRRRHAAYRESSARTPAATITTMITRDDFQLYSVTCLYLQVKILSCATPRRKLSVQSLVEMSRGQYSRREIEATERDILTTMDWRVNPPTAIQYAHVYWDIILAPSWTKATTGTDTSNCTNNGGCSGIAIVVDDDDTVATMKAAAAALVEMAAAEGSFVSSSPGLVGLAAVLIAVRLVVLSPCSSANNGNCRADEESIQRLLLGQLLEGTTTVIESADDKKDLERIYLQLQRLDC